MRLDKGLKTLGCFLISINISCLLCPSDHGSYYQAIQQKISRKIQRKQVYIVLLR